MTPAPPSTTQTLFYLWGGMGAAAMMGTWVLRSRSPTRRVVVVTGDGEMLMAYGLAFATIGAKSPKNLVDRR